jgi:uncharacterized membrane-anchored protein
MRWFRNLMIALLLTPLAAHGQQEEEPAAVDEAPAEEPHPLSRLDWIVGPTEVEVGSFAKLAVPEGFMFLHPEETTKFQEFIENPTSGRESLIAPDDLRWFGLFEFDDIGYVKDDEEIDAAALLDSIKEGTKAGNEERRRRGWAELHITGWRFEPRYDASTQRLEWAIDGVSENLPVVNFNTRLLGRKGVTSATLVADPEALDAAVTEFKDVLTGFDYVSGERYADVQEGDRMAEYGLAALIAGGGAAVAAKSGLLKSLWKVLAAAGAAVAVWLGRLFRGKKQQDA